MSKLKMRVVAEEPGNLSLSIIYDSIVDSILIVFVVVEVVVVIEVLVVHCSRYSDSALSPMGLS